MLSALNAAAAPAADLVKDSGIDMFMTDVIDASMQAPVIVLFWASRSDASKAFGPLLEKQVRALKGAARMVRIDIDKNPEIAQQFRIQSVPAVYGFFQGRPLDGFMGALPEGQLKQWFDRIMKIAGGAGLHDPGAEIEAALQHGETLLAEGDWQGAQDIFGDIVGIDPANGAAYAGVVRSMVAGGHLDQARGLLDAAPAEVAEHKALVQARAALDLADQAAKAGPIDDLAARLDAAPGDHQLRYDLALGLLAGGKREDAADHLLYIVRAQRGWNEEAARKQLVTLFEVWGPADPLTVETRKRLTSLLFA